MYVITTYVKKARLFEKLGFLNERLVSLRIVIPTISKYRDQDILAYSGVPNSRVGVKIAGRGGGLENFLKFISRGVSIKKGGGFLENQIKMLFYYQNVVPVTQHVEYRDSTGCVTERTF